jgi:DNA invertase Pin-like site-specific DNA recombinase
MTLMGRRLRVDGYVRVSDVAGRKGPSFISPRVQRERIAAWCALYDARLLTVFEELDESGGRADRPLLMEALGRIEAGQSEGLVVAKLDRFGRSLHDALEHIDRIQQAGGTFVSVQDQFDLGSDHGRLVLRMMLSFAEYERDRFRTTWDDAQRNAIARGIHTASAPPVGYRKGPDGRLRVDARSAPAVAEVFKMRAEGATIAHVAQYLREHRVGWSKGATVWSRGSVEGLLNNRVYLGEAHNGAYRRPGAHAPLIDEVTWRLAQYRPNRTYGTRYPGLLYGLLRCASCRSLMKISSGERHRRAYACGRLPQHRGACPDPARVDASTIEALAEDLVFAAGRRRPQIARKARSASLAAERSLTACEGRLARYRDSDRIIDALDERHYAEGLAARMDAVQTAAEVLRERRAAMSSSKTQRLHGIERRWPELDLEARRIALRAAIEMLFVRPDRSDAIEERTWICEPGEAPTRVPRPRHHLPPRAFAFPRGAAKQRRQERRMLAARQYGWTDDDIEQRLRALLSGRDVFPTAEQFMSTGQRRLYDHVALRGGGPYWAARLGVRYEQGQRSVCLLWTRERIHGELSELVAGRRRWPTHSEFRAEGKDGLRRAVVRFGGMEEWAAAFGLPVARRRGSHTVWTDDNIEAALSELISDRYDWPRRREFNAAGLGGCYHAIWRGDGVAAWAARMGVVQVPSRGGRKPMGALQPPAS